MEYTIETCPYGHEPGTVLVLVWGDPEMVDTTARRTFSDLGELRKYVRRLRELGLRAV